jgi:VanZ family protein
MEALARRVRCWLPAIVWMGLIFLASTRLFSFESTGQFLRPILRWMFPEFSESTLHVLQVAIRKLAHMTEYGILAGLVFRALRRSAGVATWLWDRRHGVMAWVVCLGFAVLDELHQATVPNRTGNIKDVGWDVAGAGIILAAIWLGNRWRASVRVTKGLPDPA